MTKQQTLRIHKNGNTLIWPKMKSFWQFENPKLMKLQKKKKEKKEGVVFLRSKEKPGMEIELRILVPNKGAIVWFRGTHHLFLLCFSIVYIWVAEIWNSVLILEVESHRHWSSESGSPWKRGGDGEHFFLVWAEACCKTESKIEFGLKLSFRLLEFGPKPFNYFF